MIDHEDTVVINLALIEEIMRRDQRTCHGVHRTRGVTNRAINQHTRTINDKDSAEHVCSSNIEEQCKLSGVQCRYNGIKKRVIGIASRRKRNTGWLRLGGLFVTLLVVSVHSAPTMTLNNKRLNSPEKWMNPCGEGLALEDNDPGFEYGPLTDSDLLNMVAVQARTALHQAEGFRDDYIRKTFNTDFSDLHSEWKDNHYDWLPGTDKIPKQLGEPLELEYLSKMGLEMLDNILLDVYEYMQTYAVGIEQIVWDQEDHRLEFLQKFKDTESSLQTVLCEIQAALIERGVTPRNNVTRKSMSDDYRGVMSIQATFRNLRDWLIFRDYMNGLEYVVQLFGYLSRTIKS